MWKLQVLLLTHRSLHRFSPLAGIRYVETIVGWFELSGVHVVSVPLRGLDMWKLCGRNANSRCFKVSVPLRGLDMWKRAAQRQLDNAYQFQSPCGD